MRSEKTKTVSKDERGNKGFRFCIKLTPIVVFFIFSLIYSINENLKKNKKFLIRLSLYLSIIKA